MTEIMLSQVETTDMGFLWRVQGATRSDKLRSCDIRKAVNVELRLRIERCRRYLGSPCAHNVLPMIGEASPAGYTSGKVVQRSPKDQMK